MVQKQQVIKLKKSPFECAKVAVKRSFLYTDEKFLELVDLSFDEILKFMHEHDFKNAINTSYAQYEGFYLIERILNFHLSRVYKEIFRFASPQNKFILDLYYLKYQIHNLMALIRCRHVGEEDIEGYLIGSETKKSKFLKAYSMPKIEDAIEYICKKFDFEYDIKSVLDAYSKGLFELENYLYKVYYEKLNEYVIIFNGNDEKHFFRYISDYIDILNARTYMKLKVESVGDIKFEDLFVTGGSLDMKFFRSLNELDLEDSLKKLKSKYKDLEVKGDKSYIAGLDRKLNELKSNNSRYLKNAGFGSPFYIFKYLFDVESEMKNLRVLLKGKYLGLQKDEILSMMGYKNV